ncbi:MAG: hypothetical protein IPI73_22305 [Betaproteobacteria bacterium]|nr:hypothetical protein [Betaproteobacteria bacterium]
MPPLISRAIGCAALWTACSAHASFHTFQINEIYSSPSDGAIQFIELRESQGAFGQNFFAGNTLTSGSGAGQQTFVFPSNLPSSNTAGKFVLIGTQSFAALGVVAPDYIVPDGFLSQPAGAVNFAFVDSVNYTQLPGDGATSIDRNGVPQTNSPRNFAGATGSIPGAPGGVTEFYNTTLDHYFLTADPVEGASTMPAVQAPPGRGPARCSSGGPKRGMLVFRRPRGGRPQRAFPTPRIRTNANQVKNDRRGASRAWISPPRLRCPAPRARRARPASFPSIARTTTALPRTTPTTGSRQPCRHQRQITPPWTGEGIVRMRLCRDGGGIGASAGHRWQMTLARARSSGGQGAALPSRPARMDPS